jgi:hypothetical protein
MIDEAQKKSEPMALCHFINWSFPQLFNPQGAYSQHFIFFPTQELAQ